jgi:hypothetical protein
MDLILCGLLFLYHKLHAIDSKQHDVGLKTWDKFILKKKKKDHSSWQLHAAYFMLNTTQLSFPQDSVLSVSAYFIDHFTFATSIRIQIVKSI